MGTVKMDQLADVMRAAFQIDGNFYLFRWRHVGGRDEFIMEGYRGEVLYLTTNPKHSFQEWVLERIGVVVNLFEQT